MHIDLILCWFIDKKYENKKYISFSAESNEIFDVAIFVFTVLFFWLNATLS